MLEELIAAALQLKLHSFTLSYLLLLAHDLPISPLLLLFFPNDPHSIPLPYTPIWPTRAHSFSQSYSLLHILHDRLPPSHTFSLTRIQCPGLWGAMWPTEGSHTYCCAPFGMSSSTQTPRFTSSTTFSHTQKCSCFGTSHSTRYSRQRKGLER